MARRFHDENFSDDVDDEFDDEDDFNYHIIEEDYELIKIDTKKELLEKSIDMAKKSCLFWRFRSKNTQLKMIKDIFNSLKELIDIEKLENKK